jgi:hypothetical protein
MWIAAEIFLRERGVWVKKNVLFLQKMSAFSGVFAPFFGQNWCVRAARGGKLFGISWL